MPPASGPNTFGPLAGGKSPPARDGLKARRRVALQAAARRVAQRFECRQLVTALLQRAEFEEWSARELSRRIAINRMTMARLSRGQGNLAAWLPCLRAAITHLDEKPGENSPVGSPPQIGQRKS